MLKLFDINQIENYVKDPRFEGVVFVFRERRNYEHIEAFILLKNGLEATAKSIDIVGDPQAYPELTLYRLK